MKRAILFVLVSVFAVSAANAGVLKVASYPARHPKKTAHKVYDHAVHPVYKAGKAFVW